jgi:hypothetical protein
MHDDRVHETKQSHRHQSRASRGDDSPVTKDVLKRRRGLLRIRVDAHCALRAARIGERVVGRRELEVGAGDVDGDVGRDVKVLTAPAYVDLLQQFDDDRLGAGETRRARVDDAAHVLRQQHAAHADRRDVHHVPLGVDDGRVHKRRRREASVDAAQCELALAIAHFVDRQEHRKRVARHELFRHHVVEQRRHLVVRQRQVSQANQTGDRLRDHHHRFRCDLAESDICQLHATHCNNISIEIPNRRKSIRLHARIHCD